MSIHKIKPETPVAQNEKGNQTIQPELQPQRVKIIKKNLRKKCRSMKKVPGISNHPRFVPTTPVLRSMEGKNRNGKMLYKVHSLNKYKKHTPIRMSRRAIKEKVSDPSIMHSDSDCFKDTLPESSLYFANIKIPISLRKEFGMKHTRSSEASFASTLPPKAVRASIDSKPRLNLPRYSQDQFL